MKIDLSLLNADNRRRKREVVADFEVQSAGDVSEHEAVHRLQRDRKHVERTSVALARATYEHGIATEQLANSRRDVRRISEN